MPSDENKVNEKALLLISFRLFFCLKNFRLKFKSELSKEPRYFAI